MKKNFHFTVDCDWIPNSEKALPEILSLIEKYKLKPTFFLTGKFALKYREHVKDICARGYEIGSHGLRHGLDPYENYGVSERYETKRYNLNKSTDIIDSVTGIKPTIFRAPRFCISNDTFKILHELEYRIDSSIAVNRFDFGIGTMNSLKYFFKKNHSHRISDQILEVPPSAFILPLNMRLIRIFGVGFAKYFFNIVKSLSCNIVFYLHPAEFISETELIYPYKEKEFYTNCGPHNLTYLDMFLDFIINKNVKSEPISTHLNKNY